jgi:glucose-1-phosphate thymidylyltransferase
MRAIIPVAGVGTRLRPHTYTLPKVLLNVAGKPILGHIIDAISTQGIDKITVITGYMGKLVQEYVNERHKINAEFVPQRESLGLGHALWVARDTFNSEPLVIILGDTIFDVDLSLAFNSGFSAIGVKEVEDPRRFGVVELDSKGFITRFIEKPEEPISNLVIVGIYFIQNTKLFKECLEELITSEIKTKGEYQLTDALQLMLQKGEQFTTFPVEGWYDCGKPETLLSTNRYLLEKNEKNYSFKDAIVIPPSFVASNAIVERSIIGPYVTVAEGAIVSDSVVKNSIISDGATVSSSLLEESIIGNNAIVKGNFYHLNVGNSSEVNF